MVKPNRAWRLIALFWFFVEAAYAVDVQVSAQRTIEIGTQSLQLNDNKPLPAGDYELKAEVELPLAERQYVVERQRIELISKRPDGVVSLGAPRIYAKANKYDQPELLRALESNLNLLDWDEFWLTYSSRSELRQCAISVEIEAMGTEDSMPKRVGISSAIPLKLFSISRQARHVDVALSDSKNVTRRDASYLLKRMRGITNDSDWRFADEGKVRIFMRLLHVDLRNAQSIELELDEAAERVNFRLSRSDTGRPTDILNWDLIPKENYIYGGKRWVRLDIGSAIRQQMPGALEAGLPLALVEVLAFVKKDARTSEMGVPIHRFNVKYVAQESRQTKDAIELLATNERIASGKWRLRVSLAALKQAKLREIRLVQGRIVPDKPECVGNYEWAGFVSNRNRTIPAVLANVQDLSQMWGGPFGVAQEGTDEVELPQFLKQVVPGAHSEGETKSVLLEGQRKEWANMGLAVTSRNASPLSVSLDSRGLMVLGRGDAEVSWIFTLSLPTYAYLAVRSGVVRDTVRGVTVRLRFQDGQTANLPYTPGEALSLRGFSGKKLIGVYLNLPISSKGGGISITDMAVFTVRAVSAEQSLKDTLVTGRAFDAYRVKLGDVVLTPKAPAEDLWRDLANGSVSLDYGRVHWNGGAGIPILEQVNPNLGVVKVWKFAIPAQEPPHVPDWLSDRLLREDRSGWLSLTLSALLIVWIVTLWQRGALQNIASSFSNLTQVSDCVSRTMRDTGDQIWNFVVEKRVAINLFMMLVLASISLYFFAYDSSGKFQSHKFVGSLLVMAWFYELNMWRWRLQQSISRPGKFLQCWIIGQGLVPPRIVLLTAGVILFFVSLDIVNQVVIAEGMTIERFISETTLVDGIALIAISILKAPQSLLAWVPIMLAVLYGFLPWLSAWSRWMMTSNALLVRWLIFAMAMYAAGFSRIAQAHENHFFTFGDLAMVGVLRAWLWRIKDFIELRLPIVAVKLYKGGGSVYFGCAALSLVATAVFELLRLEFLADHVAVIVYFCLVVGAALEIVRLRCQHRVGSDTTFQK